MVSKIEFPVVEAESSHDERCCHQEQDETEIENWLLLFSLDPVTFENIDKSVDNDDQDYEDVAGGDEEWHQKPPPWKVQFEWIADCQNCISHADAAVQDNNLIQECQGGLFEDHDNYWSIGNEDRNHYCPY